MSSIAENIKKYREDRGLTQKQLADMVGKTKNVVSNWENGINSPDTETLEMLMKIFNVDANTLFGWNDPEQIKADAEKLANIIISNPKIKTILPSIAKLNDDDLEFIKNFIDRINKNK